MTRGLDRSRDEDQIEALRRVRRDISAAGPRLFGRDKLVSSSNKPCCALGHAAFVAGTDAWNKALDENIYETGRALGLDETSVDAITGANDTSAPEERKAAVLAAIDAEIRKIEIEIESWGGR